MTLQELLGTELPVIQAPMAGVQGSALAVAVSNAGGLGSLPCAMLEPAAIRRELFAIHSQCAKPYNVNFFCHPQPAVDRGARGRVAGGARALLRGIRHRREQHRPRARAAALQRRGGRRARGVPARRGELPFRPALGGAAGSREGAGARRCSPSATTVEEALWLEAQGVDAVIAQGVEAGGHRGMFLTTDIATQVGTFALVPQVVRAVQVPVIAAGGIADARGVAAAMALGAAGVQVGTAYLLCPEVTTSGLHRAALKSEAARVTALTNLFTGRPARGIVNRIMRELGPMSPLAPAFPLAAAAIAPLAREGGRRGQRRLLAAVVGAERERLPRESRRRSSRANWRRGWPDRSRCQWPSGTRDRRASPVPPPPPAGPGIPVGCPPRGTLGPAAGTPAPAEHPRAPGRAHLRGRLGARRAAASRRARGRPDARSCAGLAHRAPRKSGDRALREVRIPQVGPAKDLSSDDRHHLIEPESPMAPAPKRQHLHAADLRGLGRLAIDATLGVMGLVETMHHNISRVPGPLGKSTQKPHEGHHGAGLPQHPRRDAARGRRRSTWRSRSSCRCSAKVPLVTAARGGASPRSTACWAITSRKAGNPLAIPMRLRRDGQPLELTSRPSPRRYRAPSGQDPARSCTGCA